MAAAECIPVNIANSESEEIKKLNEAGDAEANVKTQDSPAEGAAETNTENSNTESSEAPASNEVVEEDHVDGAEEECDERLNGNKNEEEFDEECEEEEELEDDEGNEAGSEECSNDADEILATKRPADEEDEPAKKLCTENDNSD